MDIVLLMRFLHPHAFFIHVPPMLSPPDFHHALLGDRGISLQAQSSFGSFDSSLDQHYPYCAEHGLGVDHCVTSEQACKKSFHDGTHELFIIEKFRKEVLEDRNYRFYLQEASYVIYCESYRGSNSGNGWRASG